MQSDVPDFEPNAEVIGLQVNPSDQAVTHLAKRQRAGVGFKQVVEELGGAPWESVPMGLLLHAHGRTMPAISSESSQYAHHVLNLEAFQAKSLPYTVPVDLRKGFDGLATLVTQQLHRDPLTGDLFLFVSRTRVRAKVLHSD
jgi:hypothetical protein